MDTITEACIDTPYGIKTVSVQVGDIRDLREPLDIMTISAFHNNYYPTRGTLLGALHDYDIDTYRLSQHPSIDLRHLCGIWLSDEVFRPRLPIRRIGCIEMVSLNHGILTYAHRDQQEQSIIHSIRAYFSMLDIATASGIPVRTLGLPILGGGNQGVPVELISIPVINECMAYLRRNEETESIRVITYNQRQAAEFARRLDESYAMLHAAGGEMTHETSESEASKPAAETPLVFLSYSSRDKNVADNLCAKIEAAGMRVWYAPRDVDLHDYASSIVSAIDSCTHFVVILSRNSLTSEHVLNEIDLAFQKLGKGTQFAPLKIDEGELGPAFRYYLSRQHWMDAHVPPLERRLDEFVTKLAGTVV